MTMMSIWIIICLIFTKMNTNESAKILAMFPFPSISHQVVFRPLTQELAKRGHEVFVITPNPAFPEGDTPPNLTEIDVQEISYEVWKKFLNEKRGDKNNLVNQFTMTFELLSIIFEKQLQAEAVQNLINEEEDFDLLIIEGCVRSSLSLSHLYNVPVIKMDSFGGMQNTYEIMGVASHPILYPLSFSRRVFNLTFWETILEMRHHFDLQTAYDRGEVKEDEMLKSNFGSDIPTLNGLNNKVQLHFLNTNPFWNANRPIPLNVIEIGGGKFHQKTQKPLPEDLQAFLDSSVNGVIYMSFGTNCHVSKLQADRIQIFVRVFSKLKYNILWKWENDVLPGRSENIRIGKWFPQYDLLRHPKVKLFITQGGLQSTEETITAGVPVVGIPMQNDQWFNTEKYLQFKIGRKLSLDELTDEELRDAIETVIEDPSYRENIMKLGTLMRDQRHSPLPQAVWWTEYLLKYGGQHLRAPAANMPWFEFFEVELFLIVFIVVLIILASLGMFIVFLYRLVMQAVNSYFKFFFKLS